MQSAPLPEVLTTFIRDRGDRTADHAALLALAARCLGTPPTRLDQRCPRCGSRNHGPLDAVVPAVPATPAVGRAAPTMPFSADRSPATADPTVHVSLSRAGGWVALAATTAAPLGVDLESVTAARAASFDEVAFTPHELRALAAHPSPVADRMRTTAWTAKEAILKAHRTALNSDPRLLTLDLTPSPEAPSPPRCTLHLHHSDLAPSPEVPNSPRCTLHLHHSDLAGVTPSTTTLLDLPTPDPTDLVATVALLGTPAPSIRLTLV